MGVNDEQIAGEEVSIHCVNVLNLEWKEFSCYHSVSVSILFVTTSCTCF